MTKFLSVLLLCSFSGNILFAQLTDSLSPKVSVGVHPNIETYFIAERLAVQHIDSYVFSKKDSLYAHQPLVYFAYQHFKKYQDTPCILRIAELMKYLRDHFYDNAQTIQYLLFQKPFPENGEQYPFSDSSVLQPDKFPEVMQVATELRDSLFSFYKFAKVGAYLSENISSYRLALKEVEKDMQPKVFPFMEKYYGENFYRYSIYIMPSMPITVGEDNYRAFGPTLHLPEGPVSAMVFSSSKMVPLKSSLKLYSTMGFDNREVTHFLTVHEIGHSFVNPHIKTIEKDIEADSALFTPALAKLLEPSYISSWTTCVIEHFVRLGEIRVAVSMNDTAQVNYLRNLHIHQFKFVLLPMLEKKIEEYEANRNKYPDFNSFLPQLYQVLHALTPADIDKLVTSASLK